MRKRRWICGICLALAFLAGCGKERVLTQADLEVAVEETQTTEPQTAEKYDGEQKALEIPSRSAMAGKVITSSETVSTKFQESGGANPEIQVEANPEIQAEGNTQSQAEGIPEDHVEENSESMAEEIPGEESLPEEERELTEQELKKLQWSIRSSDNGFFVHTYYRPEEIDWEQVFYNGAGIKIGLSDDQVALIRERLRTERLEEEQRKAELMGIEPSQEDEASEPKIPPFTEEELNLNADQITAVTLRSVQSFVKSRTGLDYSEARKPLEWPELSRNVFYFVHRDSNAFRVELMSGKVCGNRYELIYRKSVWAKEKKPEFVMQVEIENGKWRFISNLPYDTAPPITLADIDFYSSKELARMQGVEAMLDVPEPEEEDYYEEESDPKKKAKDPTYYWAVITAREDNSLVSIDRTYRGDGISMELLEKRSYLPGEALGSYRLDAGQKIAVLVTLEDVPKLRVRISCDQYYGDYAFGSENRLKRVTKEGQPLSTYVYGRDVDGEKRGTEFANEAELLRFLEGTWIFYDSEMGEYTATVTFNAKGGIVLHTAAQDYVLEISGYDRMYADVRSAPPDLIKIRTTDAETLDVFTKYYPSLRKKVGDYRIKAVQMDGEQLLLLSFENSGKDGLSWLLPGANPLDDEIVLYRFTGTDGPEE